MKLTIRHMTADDLMPLYLLLSDEDVMRYIELPHSMEQTKVFLDKAGMSEPPLIYAVEDKTGAFAGYVIYHEYDENSMEIGWLLRKDVWGKGYAKSLTQQLLDRARSEKKEVVLECDPAQNVTKHIAELFGFSYAGRWDDRDVYRLEKHEDNGTQAES